MSAPSSRPPIPRPVAKSSAPPPPAVESVKNIPAAYAVEPPVIRDRAPNLELEVGDDDIVEAEPVNLVRRSTPPPPPPARKSSVPPVSVQPVFNVVEVPKPAPLPVIAEPSPVAESVVPAPVSSAPARLPADDEPSSGIRSVSPSIPDPLDILFDAVYELEFADSPEAAALVCAKALQDALLAKAVVIHSHHLTRREIRVIGAVGPSAGKVLGTVEPGEDDFVASAAICNGKPVTMTFHGELPRLAPTRLSTLSASRSLVAVPILAWNRCVALIEVIDADDDYAARVADAVAYVGERLAEFLAERAAA